MGKLRDSLLSRHENCVTRHRKEGTQAPDLDRFLTDIIDHSKDAAEVLAARKLREEIRGPLASRFLQDPDEVLDVLRNMPSLKAAALSIDVYEDLKIHDIAIADFFWQALNEG